MLLDVVSETQLIPIFLDVDSRGPGPTPTRNRFCQRSARFSQATRGPRCRSQRKLEHNLSDVETHLRWPHFQSRYHHFWGEGQILFTPNQCLRHSKKDLVRLWTHMETRLNQQLAKRGAFSGNHQKLEPDCKGPFPRHQCNFCTFPTVISSGSLPCWIVPPGLY